MSWFAWVGATAIPIAFIDVSDVPFWPLSKEQFYGNGSYDKEAEGLIERPNHHQPSLGCDRPLGTPGDRTPDTCGYPDYVSAPLSPPSPRAAASQKRHYSIPAGVLGYYMAEGSDSQTSHSVSLHAASETPPKEYYRKGSASV